MERLRRDIGWWLRYVPRLIGHFRNRRQLGQSVGPALRSARERLRQSRSGLQRAPRSPPWARRCTSTTPTRSYCSSSTGHHRCAARKERSSCRPERWWPFPGGRQAPTVWLPLQRSRSPPRGLHDQPPRRRRVPGHACDASRSRRSSPGISAPRRRPPNDRRRRSDAGGGRPRRLTCRALLNHDERFCTAIVEFRTTALATSDLHQFGWRRAICLGPVQ
jgi:hypothetical protein